MFELCFLKGLERILAGRAAASPLMAKHEDPEELPINETQIKVRSLGKLDLCRASMQPATRCKLKTQPI